MTICHILARHLPVRSPNAERYHLPRPVILDAYLRLHPDCKLLKNYNSGMGRRPWIICSSSASSLNRVTLENAGARVIEVTEQDGQSICVTSYMFHCSGGWVTGKILIPDLLRKLRSFDIHSVMVEGGASVIGSFLAEVSISGEGGGLSNVVDTVIVTVAPTFVGDDGVGYGIGFAGAQVQVPSFVWMMNIKANNIFWPCRFLSCSISRRR
jgi:2,5-diamino-6-(ribosylamino)-4(3H)-pyrimidinone 5'-phosphate reductase